MARIVIFDVATDRVAEYLPSAHTPDYSSRPDALVNPPGLAILVGSVVPRNWMQDGGDVRAMTAPEITARDAEIAAARQLNARTSGKEQFDGNGGVHLRALAEIVVREINILRAKHGDPPRTLAQIKTAIGNTIDAGEVDE